MLARAVFGGVNLSSLVDALLFYIAALVSVYIQFTLLTRLSNSHVQNEMLYLIENNISNVYLNKSLKVVSGVFDMAVLGMTPGMV